MTITRVADRAAGSVGTLYQYFPNRQTLLFAVLEDHLDLRTRASQTAHQDDQRSGGGVRKTIIRMLESAPETRTSPGEFAIQMMLAATFCAMRVLAERHTCKNSASSGQ
jgi:AcrR family transcriptional regulator